MMFEDVNTIYKLKLFVLRRVGNFRLLRILDDVYHVVCLPFGYASYLVHRLLGRPYFGIWMASAQGHPGRFPYMRRTVAHLAKALGADAARGLRILEIGAYAGGSAIVWAKALQENGISEGKLVSVDPWDSYIDTTGNRRIVFRVMNHNLGNGNVLRLFVRNLKSAGVSGLCHQFRGRSEDILPMLKTRFDIIYIDADHHVDSVSKDLSLAAPLLKDGGILCGAGLERQLADLDQDLVKANFHTDLFIDPRSGQTFHPGLTYAVGTFFGRKISHYGGYWIVRKNGDAYDDVTLG